MSEHWLKRAKRVALTTLYPPRCLGCAEPLPGEELGPLFAAQDAPPEPHYWFCVQCAPHLTPLSYPCPICAESRPPFLDRAPATGPCQRCQQQSPPYVLARSLWEHRGPAAAAVRALKQHGYQDSALGLGAMLSPLADTLSFDALVPVPLTPAKRKARGFNQSQLLAAALAARLGLPVLEAAARKEASVKASKGQDREARQRAVAEAFVALPIPPQRLLIVDDVITTTATISALAHTLSTHGHKIVAAVSVTRA